MDSALARAVTQIKSGRTKIDPVSLAFGKQRKAIHCHASMVALICSGRAGKTRGFLLKWLEVKERKPGHISVYIALTRNSAKRIAWPQLKAMNDEYNLGLRFNEAELTAIDDNGSQLILLGANRDDLIDVLRGFPFALVGFDEAAFFRRDLLRRAIDDAIAIRMMDLDAELWVMSTPGYVMAGYHYEATVLKRHGFEVFAWSFFDNPHLPLGRDDLDDDQKRRWRIRWAETTRRKRGWTKTTPAYVREFLGRYADDPDSRVYKFDRGVHLIERMPDSWHKRRDAWTVVLGLDYGSTNAFAIVCWAFEEGSDCCYMVRAVKKYGLAPSKTATLTHKWQLHFQPDAIVGDSAAKGYIDEARVRHQIPIENADKLHKRSHIEWMNDAYRFVEETDEGEQRAPKILIVKGACEDYCSEAEKLGWDPRYEKGHPKYQQEEDPRSENDALDAGLYGWMRCYAYLENVQENTNDEVEDEDEDPGDWEGHWERGLRRAVGR